MDNLTADEQACANRCRKVWDEAVMTYQLPKHIKFVLMFSDNKQMKAKHSHNRGCPPVGLCQYVHTAGKAIVTLNRDAIKQNPKDMLEDTIPHEVAHVVCEVKPYLGHGHDAGWQAIAKRLGGTGKPMYDNNEYDMRLRKRRKFIYQIPELGKVLLSDVRHNRLQAGGLAYRTASKGIRITKEHFTGECVV